MSEQGWTALVWLLWLGVGLVLELLALSGHAPWNSLSEFVWGIEALNPILRWVFLFGFALLLVHMVTRFPASLGR